MKNEEHRIQQAIVRYLRYSGYFVFAVPNGGKRDKIAGKILKDEGALAGVADLIIVMPSEVIFVEVKTDKGKQSEAQQHFQKVVTDLDHTYLVWRSVDDAVLFSAKQ